MAFTGSEDFISYSNEDDSFSLEFLPALTCSNSHKNSQFFKTVQNILTTHSSSSENQDPTPQEAETNVFRLDDLLLSTQNHIGVKCHDSPAVHNTYYFNNCMSSGSPQTATTTSPRTEYSEKVGLTDMKRKISDQSRAIKKLPKSSITKSQERPLLALNHSNNNNDEIGEQAKKQRGKKKGLSKAERILKNRISAQKSRDKMLNRLQELETLHVETTEKKQRLLTEKQLVADALSSFMLIYGSLHQKYDSLQQSKSDPSVV